MLPKKLLILAILTPLISLSLSAPAQAETFKFDLTGTQLICNDYIFIGMRGSGEKFGNPNGGASQFASLLGAPLGSLYDELNIIPQLKNKMTPEGVKGYEAADLALNINYISAVTSVSGTELITKYLDYYRTCPKSKFILAGYSQGSYALHYFLDFIRKTSPQYLDRVVASVLLASPSNPVTGILTPGADRTPDVAKIFDPIRVNLLAAATVAEAASRIPSPIANVLEKVIKSRLNSYAQLETQIFKSNYIKSLQSIPPQFFQDGYTMMEGLKTTTTDLKQPSVPTLFYQREGDVIGDFYTALKGSLALAESINKEIDKEYWAVDPRRVVAKQFSFPVSLYTVMKDAGVKHSSYCPKPKIATKDSLCNEAENKKFLKASVDFITRNLNTYRIPEKWLGAGWIGKGATCSTVLDILKGANISESKKYFSEGIFPVLAVQPEQKSIWFLRAISYDHFSLFAFTKGKGWGKPDNLQGSYGQSLTPMGAVDPYFFDPDIKHSGLRVTLKGNTFTCGPQPK